MSLLSVLVVLLVLLCSAASQFPIPRRSEGFPLLGSGGTDAPIVIDGFFDVLCPDCRRAWPVAKELLVAYAGRIHFRFHTFPLPYHTWGFVANQGVHVLQEATKGNQTAMLAYLQLLFDQQGLFSNQAARNRSQDQVVQQLAAVTASSGLLSAANFTRAIQSGPSSNAAMYAWKFGCTLGTVLATPTYLINGVFFTNDAGFSLKQWRAVLDPMLTTRSEQPDSVESDQLLLRLD